jgi:hypothetical protein
MAGVEQVGGELADDRAVLPEVGGPLLVEGEELLDG